MPQTNSVLAIISSDRARTHPKGTRWWHLGRFVSAYASVLADYDEIRATEHTGIALKAALASTQFPRVAANVLNLGPGFQGVVCLAALVAQKKVQRVLWFQDPDDLKIESAENYALLRNCNLAGAHVLINAGAHLWALYQSDQIAARQLTTHVPAYIREPYESQDLHETIYFIAHDAEKSRMSRFVFHYRHILAKFPRLLATSGTLRHIDSFMKDHAPPRERPRILPVGATATMAHGPSGGDVIVASELFEAYKPGAPAYRTQHILHHVLFFPDNRQSHPHEADIRVLLKTCVNPEHRVNLILNSRMAEEWANRYS